MPPVPGSSPRPPEPSRPAAIALLGVPLGIGAPRPGAELGPDALRAAGLSRRLAELGYVVADHGDVVPADSDDDDGPAPPNARHYHAIAAWTRALSARAYQLARSDAMPVFLGGDHALSMGSINGVARHWREAGRALFVLWLDAHADYNTPAISPTGNMHGMSAAFVCGEPGLDALLADVPRCRIPSQRLALFGARAIDPLEQRLLAERHVAIVSMREIAQAGVIAPLRRFLDVVAAADGVLHLSFDIDGLDPALAPGVGTPESGGLDARDAGAMMELLRASGRVRSVDVVELNPLFDQNGHTARLAVDLVAALLGRAAAHRPESIAAMDAARLAAGV